jgi:nucleotide-binding universal stress UspA family protein
VPARAAAVTGTITGVDGDAFELGTDGPSRILVGIDGTDTSMRATAYAAGLARRQGSALVALYVLTGPAVTAPVAGAAGALLDTQNELADQLRSTVRQLNDHLGIRAELEVRAGNPYRELLAVAHERRVDAIVVGASTSAGHRFVGSLAGRLVKDAAWPVTVVP